MNIFRLAAIATLLASLSACTTYNYTSQQFVPKDPGKLNHLKKSASTYQFDDIEYIQADGAVSRGISIHKPETNFTVLYFMGSGVRVDANGSYIAKVFTELNANFISFDYRDFGRSDAPKSNVSLSDLEADTLALYDHVRKITKGKLIVHGHSFGSFVAAKLASLRPLDGLVLEGTGTSAQAYSDNMIPWFAKPFITIKLDQELQSIDNRIALKQYKGPIMIINGSNDVQTPAATAHDLYLALDKPNKRYEEIRDAGHMNAMSKPETLKAYREFIQTN
ncbi:alpha/beta fold hydrolase [Undibacterium seohonense]|uniref:Alpha/beta fold hydrolase n=1 Tax=Undibacterium seohonense TaxID=1344950 RepID=A0ABR6XA55_9BURK|nr:alpha/beta fold hydrolase [Undibacterium seohonense]MBC3809578.1 alpha/beta fold hydrolase [Undibacterium seohonense]